MAPMAEYDQIAQDYKKSKFAPWRIHVEAHSLFSLLGDVSGKSVLDLACGDGIYSRQLRVRGASRVVGVDLSSRMVELARAEEAAAPLGITYQVGDARELALAETFDVVFAAYLLNYARTPGELQEMAAAVARHLRPGGRFIGINNNPAHSPANFSLTRPFGFVKSLPAHGEVREGVPITYTIFQDDSSFTFDNYHLDASVHERALHSAGLRKLRWHAPRLSPEAEKTHGRDHWAPLLDDPPVICFEAVRT